MNKRVLFVYYTFSLQTRKVVDAMAEEASALGCHVTTAQIAFSDARWSKRFSTVPMKVPAIVIPTILPAQRLRKTGEIDIPEEALGGDYDLIIFGSPTWWLTTNMPIRSYLESPAAAKILEGKPFAAASVSRRYWRGNIRDVRRLGEKNGGRWIGQTHFVATGGQVKSMLSWLAFMKHGEPRARAFFMKMPPPNLKPNFREQATTFVDSVVAQTFGGSPTKTP